MVVGEGGGWERDEKMKWGRDEDTGEKMGIMEK